MEVTMSFTSGIGSLQQATNPITPAEAKPAIQASVSESVANQNEVQISNVDHADQTNLSSTAGLVAQALESSDIRSAKVASLQQAIAAGTYNVSSSDVADKIIQSLLD
jgi:negative regulator of flagellin synthesis FlgM